MGVFAILLLAVAAIALSLGGGLQWAWGAVAAVIILLLTQINIIPRRLLITTGIITSVALVALPFTNHPWRTIADGLHLGGLFIALIASVSLLAQAASRAEPVRRMAEELLGRGPRLWGVPLVLVSHLFPAMLNIAGTAILCDMASRRRAQSDAEQRVLDEAVYGTIRRGFASAVCWSPMFGNIVVLLALYPTLEWPDVAPYGIAAGLALSLLGLAIGPLRNVSTGLPSDIWHEAGTLLRALAPMLVGMTAFLAIALLAHRLLEISMALAIIGLSPPAAMLWTVAQRRDARSALRQVHSDIRQRFPALAPEAVLFAASGCMAVAVGAAIPQDTVVAALSPLQGSIVLTLIFIIGANLMFAVGGMHPLLVTLLLVTVVPPEVVGLSPLVHFIAILIGLGLAFIVSPFTIVAALIDRYVHRGPFVISYRWGGRFALAAAVAAVAVLWAIEVNPLSWWRMG